MINNSLSLELINSIFSYKLFSYSLELVPSLRAVPICDGRIGVMLYLIHIFSMFIDLPTQNSKMTTIRLSSPLLPVGSAILHSGVAQPVYCLLSSQYNYTIFIDHASP